MDQPRPEPLRGPLVGRRLLTRHLKGAVSLLGGWGGTDSALQFSPHGAYGDGWVAPKGSRLSVPGERLACTLTTRTAFHTRHPQAHAGFTAMWRREAGRARLCCPQTEACRPCTVRKPSHWGGESRAVPLAFGAHSHECGQATRPFWKEPPCHGPLPRSRPGGACLSPGSATGPRRHDLSISCPHVAMFLSLLNGGMGVLCSGGRASCTGANTMTGSENVATASEGQGQGREEGCRD